MILPSFERNFVSIRKHFTVLQLGDILFLQLAKLYSKISIDQEGKSVGPKQCFQRKDQDCYAQRIIGVIKL